MPTHGQNMRNLAEDAAKLQERAAALARLGGRAECQRANAQLEQSQQTLRDCRIQLQERNGELLKSQQAGKLLSEQLSASQEYMKGLSALTRKVEGLSALAFSQDLSTMVARLVEELRMKEQEAEGLKEQLRMKQQESETLNGQLKVKGQQAEEEAKQQRGRSNQQSAELPGPEVSKLVVEVDRLRGENALLTQELAATNQVENMALDSLTALLQANEAMQLQRDKLTQRVASQVQTLSVTRSAAIHRVPKFDILYTQCAHPVCPVHWSSAAGWSRRSSTEVVCCLRLWSWSFVSSRAGSCSGQAKIHSGTPRVSNGHSRAACRPQNSKVARSMPWNSK